MGLIPCGIKGISTPMVWDDWIVWKDWVSGAASQSAIFKNLKMEILRKWNLRNTTLASGFQINAKKMTKFQTAFYTAVF
jgi:hypothetical protein